MSDQKPTADVDACEIFHARRGARELLSAAGEIPHDTADVECAFRRRARLLDYDLDDPWERLCFETDTAAKAQREREARMPAPKRPVLARSTIDATAYVIQQKDPELLRNWLRKHSAVERQEIENLLRERQAKT